MGECPVCAADVTIADDAMAGGDEPLGRARKESKKIRAKKIQEMAVRMKQVDQMLRELKARA